MRGRLIFRFSADLCRLDAASAAALDPDGAGPLSSGYDADFKEPVLIDSNHDGIGERVRREHPPVRVPCQVETKDFEELKMYASGNAPSTRIDLVFHFRDLEELALVDTETGDARIRVGDRLGGLYDLAGQLVQKVRTPPGLYVTQARPSGFGLHLARPRRNLLLVTFEDRPQAVRRMA